MTIKGITALRKAGQLEEALRAPAVNLPLIPTNSLRELFSGTSLKK